jgi:hypothetical protein
MPIKPCKTFIVICFAEETVLEPKAGSLKGEYAFILPKKIVRRLIFVRNPHSLKMEIGCGSNGTVDGMIYLLWSSRARTPVRNNSGQTPSIAGMSAAMLDALYPL